MSRLDAFLKSIAPEHTLDEIDARLDRAVNSYPSDVASVRHWKEFEDVLASFYCHLENQLLALRQPRKASIPVDFGRCTRILHAEYGPNGEKTAYELSCSGMEGGLPAVLRTIARHLAQQYASNESRARVASFLQSLPADEVLDSAREYAVRYRDMLPPEYAHDAPVRVMVDFWKILEQHPRAVRRIRRTGR